MLARNLIFIFALLAFSCKAQESQINWNTDIDSLVTRIQREHYVFKDRPLPAAFVARVTSLKKQIGVYSDQRMLVELEGLIAMLGDGHSYVLPWAAQHVSSYILPLRFYLFSDGLFVIDADKGFEKWIGKRVYSFGKISVDTALRRLAPYVSKDNAMGVNWIGPIFLRFQGVMEMLGATKPGERTASITFYGESGARTSFPFIQTPGFHGPPKLIPSPIASTPPPLYLRNVSNPYWLTSVRHGTVPIIYFQFNQVVDNDKESLAQFATRLGDSLRIERPRILVVDVRHNNGGNAELLPPVLATMADFKKSAGLPIIIVVTGRNTFSAAQIFVSECDTLLHTVLAGEPSSSKPNFVGEENDSILPSSGAIVSISNRYHETIPGDQRQWIEPDYLVALSSDQYFKNVDPVMDAIVGGLVR